MPRVARERDRRQARAKPSIDPQQGPRSRRGTHPKTPKASSNPPFHPLATPLSPHLQPPLAKEETARRRSMKCDLEPAPERSINYHQTTTRLKNPKKRPVFH